MTSYPPLGVANDPSPTPSKDAKDDLVKRTFPWDASATAGCVAVLTIAAAILRMSLLGSKSLWFDESLTAYRVTLPLSSLSQVVAHGEMNMFIYYLLLHGWTLVGGSSEFMLRLPSALFDATTVPLVYALGAELGDRRGGLLAALMMTINATSIEYAQTARSYSMFVALATVASVFFIRGIKRGTPASFAGYIASGTLSVYAHLFGIFALPPQWLSLFLFRADRKKAIGLTVCMLAISALSVPAFFIAISGSHGNLAWVPRTSLHSVVELFFMFAGAFDARPTIPNLLLMISYLIGIVLAFLWRPRAGLHAPGYLLLCICLPVAFTIGLSFAKPVFVPRYLLAGLPLFVLLGAIGFQRLKPALAIAMVLTVSMLSLVEDYSYYRAAPLEDWRGVIDFVAKHSQPGDALLVFPGFYIYPVGYYVSRLDHPDTFPTRIFRAPAAGEWDRVDRPKRLPSDSELGASRRIWFTSALGLDENGIQLMFPRARVVEEPTFAGVRLFLLQRSP